MVRMLAASIIAGQAFATPVLSQPALQVKPVPGQALHSLPFELYDGRIYIQASVAGSGPRTFLVDTGAQVTHLSAQLVRERGLPTFGEVGITGTGSGRVEGDYVRLAEINISGLALPIPMAISAAAEALFGPVVTNSGKAFDGVIGYDLFAAYVVEIDYMSRTIRLYDPADAPETPNADIVPISVIENKPYLRGIVSLGEHELEASFLLDTGSGGAIGFNGNFVADRDLLTIAGHTLPSMSRGVGGAVPARLGRADALKLGNTIFSRPFATYALAQGKGVSEHAAGRIGGAILRRFTLTINYPARTISLLPNANFNRPLETDMSGLALISGNGGVQVFRVEPNSAGGEAGILAGDRLLSLDGQPVSELTLEAVRGMFMHDGTTRSLVVLRNGQALTLPIMLRRRL